jgi:hypothetical protein
MVPKTLLPLRRKACWGFFCPKNSTASAGCEPANLGTKGQHTTSRPPKPLAVNINIMTNANCCAYSIKTPDDGLSLSETCRVLYQNKTEKQCILLAFIIRTEQYYWYNRMTEMFQETDITISVLPSILFTWLRTKGIFYPFIFQSVILDK